jgi:hypothetical protein
MGYPVGRREENVHPASRRLRRVSDVHQAINDVDDSFVVADVGNVWQNEITFGNGVFDAVFANVNVSHNTIVFGNGAFDNVGADGKVSHNTIIFGDGHGDSVSSGINGSVSQNTIIFGDGVRPPRRARLGNIPRAAQAN